MKITADVEAAYQAADIQANPGTFADLHTRLTAQLNHQSDLITHR